MSKAAAILADFHPALLSDAHSDSDEGLSVALSEAEGQKLICD